MNTISDLRTRFTRMTADSIESRLVLGAGSMDDYRALSEHHYLTARPATATRVLVLRDAQPTPAGRFAGRRAEPRAVGVLVESMPALNCRLRDWALHDRYSNLPNFKHRVRLINGDLRCISRVVVHPQWRGLGLAVRLVRAALDPAPTPFTEALAAMGKVHPFFERAGMTAYHRAPHAFDARLIAALGFVGVSVTDLAMLHRTMQRIDALPATQRTWVHRELCRWYRQTLGRARGSSTEPIVHLRAARRQLLREPVYYLHDNRAAREAPTANKEPRHDH